MNPVKKLVVAQYSLSSLILFKRGSGPQIGQRSNNPKMNTNKLYFSYPPSPAIVLARKLLTHLSRATKSTQVNFLEKP